MDPLPPAPSLLRQTSRQLTHIYPPDQGSVQASPSINISKETDFSHNLPGGYFLHCEKPSPLTEPNQQGISFLYCNITLTILFGNKNPVIFLSQSRSGKSNPSQEGGNTKTIEPCLISSFGRDPRFEPPGCRRRSAESPSPSSPEALPGSAR